MSFEIYIDAFTNEEAGNFPASEVRRRFEAVIEGSILGCWRLAFAEGPSYAEIPIPKGNLVQGFVVFNPPSYLEFWEIVAGFLADFGCVLFWPGGGAVIASLDVLPHLPKDMVETLGIPWVTTDPARIRQYVEENS